jgi:hypothetical protein
MFFKAAVVLTLLISQNAFAEFGLASGLTATDRQQILKILGLGTSGKNVSIPKGLGTNNGLELSLANEFINTETISQFIIDRESRNTLYYPKISIGKGLYERTDIFIHFIPYTATLGLSEFGGTIRFNFYKEADSGISASAIFHLNSANFNNQLTTRGLAGDLSLGMNWDYFSVFTSVGMARSKGTFIGGTQGTTDSLNDETLSVSDMHFSVGTLVRYDIYFIAAALDHYTRPVYSLKMGFHF